MKVLGSLRRWVGGRAGRGVRDPRALALLAVRSSSTTFASATRVRDPRALALLAVLAGCGRPPPRSQFPSGADALERMKATYACVNGVQGEAKIDHFGERGRVRGKADLFLVNPARVRIDVVSPLNTPAFTLTSDGRHFQLADLANQKFFYGPASACNLARLTQVPVPGHALVYLLRGEAPLLVHETSELTIAWDDGHYRVTLPSTRGAKQTVLLDVPDEDYEAPWQAQRARVRGVEVEQQGVVLYTAELGRHEPAHTAPPRVDEDGVAPPVPPSGGPCTAPVPRSIRIVVPYTEDDVLFQYGDVSLNPPLPEGTFTQPVPSAIEKIFVDCRD